MLPDHIRLTSRLEPYRDHPIWSTPISQKLKLHGVQLGDDEIDQWIDCCVTWCYNFFGTNQKEFPYIEWFRYPPDDTNDIGWYDPNDNTMGIVLQGHRTLQSLTETIIHEWIHLIQFQRNAWYLRWFNTGYNYNNHPMELEANLLSAILMPHCVKWCNDLLNIIPT
jgi:hypothetical protein